MNTQTETTGNHVKPTIKVTSIVMHKKPHLDEVVAYVLLRKYGQELFPGIEEAAPRFVEEKPFGDEATWDSDGFLPIGIGEGRFDEHRDGTEGGRIEGECAATLVAKYLGVQNKPELARLLEETFRSDNEASNSPTCLAELMKVGYRHLQKDSLTVFEIIKLCVIAIIRQETYKLSALQGEKTLKVLWDETKAADDEWKEIPKVTARIDHLVKCSMSTMYQSVTEFSSVIMAMTRAPYDMNQVILPRFEFLLIALKTDTLEFTALTEKLRRIKPMELDVLLWGRLQTIKLLVCKGDEPQLAKVARSLGNNIVLVRNSAGNFQIFTSKKVFGGRNNLSVANLVKMIRWYYLSPEQQAELSRCSRPNEFGKLSWDDLGCSGEYLFAPGIFYHVTAESIYNGTITHDAKPSELGTQALVEAIWHAFTPDYMERWCRARNIVMYPDGIAERKSFGEQNGNSIESGVEELVETWGANK